MFFAFPKHLVTLGHHWAHHAQKTIYNKLPIHRPSGRYVIMFGFPTVEIHSCFTMRGRGFPIAPVFHSKGFSASYEATCFPSLVWPKGLDFGLGQMVIIIK